MTEKRSLVGLRIELYGRNRRYDFSIDAIYYVDLNFYGDKIYMESCRSCLRTMLERVLDAVRDGSREVFVLGAMYSCYDDFDTGDTYEESIYRFEVLETEDMRIFQKDREWGSFEDAIMTMMDEYLHRYNAHREGVVVERA